MEELLFSIAKMSPIVAILVYALYWLQKRVEKKEEEITALNSQLRESEKTALEAFNKISDVLKSVSTDQTMSNKEVLNELKNLKEWLKEHMNK